MIPRYVRYLTRRPFAVACRKRRNVNTFDEKLNSEAFTDIAAELFIPVGFRAADAVIYVCGGDMYAVRAGIFVHVGKKRA